MKILHLLQNYEPSKGGTQFLFKNISENLIKIFKDEVTVCTTNSLYDPGSSLFKPLPEKDKLNGVNIYRFGFKRFERKVLLILKKFLVKLGLPAEAFKTYTRVPKSKSMKTFIDNFDAEVICASSAYYRYMDYAAYRSKLQKPKPFVLMGAIHFDDGIKTYVPQWILKNIEAADLYIANTSFEKSCLQHLGIDGNKIRIVGCGVEPITTVTTNKQESKLHLNIPAQANVIGYLGRFAANKDILLLVDAFAELNQPNTYLLLAGAANEYLPVIEQHINKLSVQTKSHIIIKKDFTETEKQKLLLAMDVFVSPSYSESFGIVFLEAWVHQLPVIGANIGAIASVIDNDVNGLLFEARDKASLKKCIQIYIKDKNKQSMHAQAGLQKVLNQYTWEIITKKYREIYLEAISIHKTTCADLQV